jgi:hypothetical protein
MVGQTDPGFACVLCDKGAVEPGFGCDLPEPLPSVEVLLFEEFSGQDLGGLLAEDPGGRRGAAGPLPRRARDQL